MNNEKKVSDVEVNYFTKLNSINVNEHVEKKDKFNYLSWAFAVAELRKNFPSATWDVKRFNGLPYLQTPLGYFVEVEVVVNGVSMSQIHPVLDNRNRVIKEPDAFQINTSIQRCLVKAIALHGLGLYIYAGEDLPDGAESAEEVATQPSDPDRSNDPAIKAKWELLAGNLDGYADGVKKLRDKGMTWAQIEAVLVDKIQQKKKNAEGDSK